MPAFVALLRAINVGGSGKLPMRDLVVLCEQAGFRQVRTYIASGNVVFASEAPREAVKASLEARLHEYAGKPVGLHLRTAEELAAIFAANPFPHTPPARTLVIFLDGPPPADTLERISGRAAEEVVPGRHEIWVHYADGVSRSKLKIPAAKDGTARNLNTVRKLAAMAAETDQSDSS